MFSTKPGGSSSGGQGGADPQQHVAPQSSHYPPSLSQNPEAWFRHYDHDGNGLERHEVIEAVCE